jgi:hypothetical protein
MTTASRHARRSVRQILAAFTIAVMLFALGGVPLVAADAHDGDAPDQGCGEVVSAAARSQDSTGDENHGQMVSDVAHACAQPPQGSDEQDQDDDQGQDDQAGTQGKQGETHGQANEPHGHGKH